MSSGKPSALANSPAVKLPKLPLGTEITRFSRSALLICAAASK
ncbi:Uncharacterised protein [Vibrio cholerae]|nr:Uncharacterised protein [Vibrio cholerae]